MDFTVSLLRKHESKISCCMRRESKSIFIEILLLLSNQWKENLQEFDVSYHLITSENNSSVAASQQGKRKLSEDEDVRQGKVLKHPEISTDSDRASSPNPCPPPGTVWDNDRDLGSSFTWCAVAWQGADNHHFFWQEVIPMLRKFSDQTRSTCLFLHVNMHAGLLMFAGIVTSSGSLEKHSVLGFLSAWL